MTIHTMPTENGICYSQEMSDRNAQFSIFSAADPRRHCLHWILIEASLQNDHVKAEAGTNNITNFGRNPEETRNVLTFEKGSSSNLQNTSIAVKGEKRSLEETFSESQELKRQKTEEDCRNRRDNLGEETMSRNEEKVKKETESRRSSVSKDEEGRDGLKNYYETKQ